MQHREMQKAKNTFTGFGGSCGKTKALMRVTCMGENTNKCFALSILQVWDDERPSMTAGAPQLPASFSSDPYRQQPDLKSWQEIKWLEGRHPPFPFVRVSKDRPRSYHLDPKPLQSVKFCCPLLGGAVVSPRSSGVHLVAYRRHKTGRDTGYLPRAARTSSRRQLDWWFCPEERGELHIHEEKKNAINYGVCSST